MIWGGSFVLLLTSTVVNRCKSHVVLTFPPARYPPLDFLDSSTTVGPCGVPKASYLHYTTLVAGDQYNITWRMNYVTEGGFKIAILDENGLEVKRLTPDNRSSNFVGQLTPLQQHFHVTVPDGFTCYGCAIQLEREVKEWGNKRKFRSCADVNIVKRFDDKAPIRFTRMDSAPTINNCMSHGKITSTGVCDCDRLYSGNMCQYKDDCLLDTDCGKGGSCVDMGDQHYPRHVCYCGPSRFGSNCQHEFKPSVLDVAFPCFNYQYKRNEKWMQRALQRNAKSSPDVKYDLFDTSCYDKKILNEEQDSIYWRKLGDELEIVLEVKGQSWIGLGWRPIGLGPDCKKFPIDTEENVKAKVKRSKKAVFEAQKIIPQILLLTLSQFAKPYLAKANYTDFNDNIAYKKLALSNESIDSFGTVHPEEGLFNSEASEAIPSPPQKTESVMHPMDCTDIIMASAIGDQSRFADMYTRDRSTPMSDELYYGKNSIKAAYGFEFSDGKTVLMFRKNIKAADIADHPLGPGFVHLIFAKGQQSLNRSRPLNFADVVYKPKIFMYHGHTNRVALSLKFVD